MLKPLQQLIYHYFESIRKDNSAKMFINQIINKILLSIDSVRKHFIARRVVIVSYVLFCCFLLNTTLAESEEQKELLPLIVTNDVLSDYYKFLGGKSPHEISDYSGKHSRRDVVEVVLLQQALKKGGLEAEIVFKTADTYLRTIEEVVVGRAAITASTIWLRDIIPQQHLQESPAIIQPGEFQVGIYTSPLNKEMLGIQDCLELQHFTAVSNKNWKVDWITLKKMNITKLINVQKWVSMVRMVDAQRADFLLAPFQHNPDMVLKVDGRILVPIKGKKVNLDGSRHFAISKKHPLSLKIQKALDQGFKKMRTEKLIRKAYKESGFFHPEVDFWQVIN